MSVRIRHAPRLAPAPAPCLRKVPARQPSAHGNFNGPVPGHEFRTRFSNSCRVRVRLLLRHRAGARCLRSSRPLAVIIMVPKQFHKRLDARGRFRFTNVPRRTLVRACHLSCFLKYKSIRAGQSPRTQRHESHGFTTLCDAISAFRFSDVSPGILVARAGRGGQQSCQPQRLSCLLLIRLCHRFAVRRS